MHDEMVSMRQDLVGITVAVGSSLGELTAAAAAAASIVCSSVALQSSIASLDSLANRVDEDRRPDAIHSSQ